MPERQPGAERLQKILARAGYGSRRACEEYIVEGRVTLNNTIVNTLGVKADPFRDTITVDGEKIILPKPVYYIINKPDDMYFSDKSADASLEDFIKGDAGRLFSAGRLDQHSRGLMVVTNDGRVANLLTHPRYKVPKVYKLTVKGNVQPRDVKNIERALYYAMNNGRFEPITLLKHGAGKSVLRIAVYEGLPQSLKDICLKFGHGIKVIERIRIGVVELAGLEAGRSRKLRKPEVEQLLQYADKADAGKMAYENELLSPADFDRDEEATNFRRKSKGTQSKSVGQRKTRTRVQSQGSSRKPTSRKPSGSRSGPSRSSSGSKPDSRKPSGNRTSSSRGSSSSKPAGRKPYGGKPSSSSSSSKPAGRKPYGGKPSGSSSSSKPDSRKPSGSRTSSSRGSASSKPSSRKPYGGKPSGSSSGPSRRPSTGKPGARKPSGGRPASRGKPTGGGRKPRG